MKINTKVKKISIATYFVMLPYLKPYNVTLIPMLDMVYQIWKVIATFILLMAFILKRKKLSIFSQWAFAFCGVWTLSMLLNAGTLGENNQVVLSIIGMCLFFDYFRNDLKFKQTVLSCLSNIAKVYILLNTITVIIQKPLFSEPEVVYLRYFLGGDNFWAFILIPLCGIMFANDLFCKNKFSMSTCIFSLLGFFNLAYQKSYAGMISYGIYLFMVLLMNCSGIKKLFSIKNSIIISLISIVSISFFNIQELIKPILNNMDKIGFNSREFIWPKAIKAFQNRWMLGYGQLTEEQINSYILYGADHTHNILLEYPFSVGIIGSIIIIGWFNYIFKMNKTIYNKKYIRVLVLCFSAFVLCGIFDFYIGLIYFYVLLCVIDLCKVDKAQTY